MSKPGSGGVASAQETHIARRERLRALAVESAELSNDPYLLRNHLGSYECRLCMTLHTNEGSYLAHTQAKRHQQNLARRAAKLASDAAQAGGGVGPMTGANASALLRRRAGQRAGLGRAGTPGYRIVKQRDPATEALSLLFALSFPLIAEGLQPRHRLMSTFEQQREAKDAHHQYLLVAAEPYAVTAFKVPNREVERGEGGVVSHWNEQQRTFLLQIAFKPPQQPQQQPQPAQPQPEEQQHSPRAGEALEEVDEEEWS